MLLHLRDKVPLRVVRKPVVLIKARAAGASNTNVPRLCLFDSARDCARPSCRRRLPLRPSFHGELRRLAPDDIGFADGPQVGL